MTETSQASPPSFQVLHRAQNVHQNYLLEASAGTGKTFSIENIVTRLLIEKEGIPLEKILIVTFTKLATRDLKIRVRQNIEAALGYLKNRIDKAPDYLLAILEKNDEEVKKATRRLENALSTFDQAQIFTIHSFCARMLRMHLFEGDLGASAVSIEEEKDSQVYFQRIVRDFFRTELRYEAYTRGQLNIVLKEYGSVEELENALLKLIKRSIPIARQKSLEEQMLEFQQVMHQFHGYGYDSSKVMEDFTLQAPAYEKLCDRKKQIKPEVLEKALALLNLIEKGKWDRDDFDYLLQEGVFIADVLHPDRKNPSGKLPSSSALHYPSFVEELQHTLYALIKNASGPQDIFLNMAATCQQMLKKSFQEMEQIGFDDFLILMDKAVQNVGFVNSIRKTFQVAIVDEFQDTDPLQWKIFDTLFLQDKSWGQLYLVGDPKQSIYAFRQADIYTYLSAADAIGKNNHASLDTNFRSQPALIYTLNLLFSKEITPDLITLPRLNSILPYYPVHAGPIAEKKFSDNLGNVHFCLTPTINTGRSKKIPLETLESKYIFPYMLGEIVRLHQKDGISYKEFAILVSDRFQGKRVASFLADHQIPATTQRNTSLLEGSALPAVQELLQAILQPKNENLFKIALGGPILGLNESQIHLLEDHSILERLLAQCYLLRNVLFERGFASFFTTLMQSSWLTDQTVSEKLLSQENGLQFYLDICQVASMLMEQESNHQNAPTALLAYLNQLIVNGNLDDECFKRQRVFDEEAVQILTLHASKGLEFEVVIPIGLITRSKTPDQILPVGNPQQLQKVTTLSEEYINHCFEIDAEKIRQLYVAMTRAKYRLYLPVITTLAEQAPELGAASPMELFLARLDQPKVHVKELYQRIAGNEGKNLAHFVEKYANRMSLTCQSLEDKSNNFSPSSIKDEVILVAPPEQLNIPQGKSFVYSFTGITKDLLMKINDYQTDAPHDFYCLEKNAFTLPAGKEIGVLLHKILELISYEAVKSAVNAEEIIPLIKPFIAKSSFSEWFAVIAEIVFRALKVKLIHEDQEFCLCELGVESRYHEIEFLYSNDGLFPVEEMHVEGGLLKGVIDMLCMHSGKYYIVDWKSNWLGSERENYNKAGMSEAMKMHHYHLQASIYRSALERYLKLIDPRPFSEIFGGVYYLFLRGIEESGEGGVYSF